MSKKEDRFMERKIGDRIKELRQKANLTQAQLAEKLGFTSQTVSNWESGSREPDIAALAQLSSLFNVSLDYLLLGKQEEAITLDDMDAEKRLSLLIKKDDVQNFKKYEYQTSAYVFGRSVNYGYHYNITLSEPNAKTWLEIIHAGAKKIFSACCDELIKRNTQKVWVAFLVYDFLDEFVKMAVDCDKPEVLETIGFRIFAVGDKPAGREIPFSQNREVGWYINRVETYFIKPETFEYIFQNREKAPKCFDYATSFELQIVPLNNYNNQRKEYTFTHLHNNIVEMAIKYKMLDVLDKVLTVYREELKNENLPRLEYNGYSASYLTGWTNTYVTGNNRVYGRVFYFRESDIKSLLEAGEIKYAKKLNDYNGEVIERMKQLNYASSKEFAKVVHLSDEEIDRFTKLHSNLSDEDRAKLECINNYILVVNKVHNLRDLKLARKIIDSGYYHYYEFVYDCLTSGKQKLLLKFFIDNGFDNLAEKLTRGKAVYSELLGESWGIFNAKEGDPEHKRLIALSNRIEENRHEMTMLNGERIMFSSEAQKLEDNKIIAYFKNCKENLYENVKRAVEAEKKAKEEAAERAKIVKGLTREHFESLLAKKDAGSRKLFIIDLCSLFDAYLKYDYHIEGEDFSARMNKYFARLNDAAPKSRTMDDGWGYQVPDTKYDEEVVIPEQERINHLSDIFNRLRIERNNIAHSERKPVKELSESELNECLDYLFR